MTASDPNGERPLDPLRETEHAALLNLLCIVEHVNATAASSALSSAHPPFLSHIMERARDQLSQAWAPTPLLEALREVDLLPDANSSLTEQQCGWLVEVERRRFERLSHVRRPLPEARRMRVLWRDVPATGARETQRQLVLMDEAFDAFAVMRDYLRSTLQIPESMLDHELQTFIRRRFHLKYRKHYVPLANICARLNEQYYGVAALSFQATHGSRVPILSTRYFLDIIAEEPGLARVDRELETAKARKRLALGFLLAFRLCHPLRIRFTVRDPAAASAPAPAAPQDEQASGISLLQPLEYSTLRARMFGSVLGIDGWIEILGGGLLPGVDLGKVWLMAGAAGSGKTSLALHLAADLAARDHLVIYFSFEESYHNISDRVVAFRLYDPQRFQIDAVTEATLEERVFAAYTDEKQRGLLLYYRGNDHGLGQILAKIRDVVEQRAKDWSRSTAVIIDSIDALEHGSVAGDDGQTRYARREQLRQLFHQLEESRVSALLLTEHRNPELPTLQHLADTYVEVGVEDGPAGRWIQFHKSRLQDFARGKHGYRLRDGKGAALVPNLDAVQRLVRRRVPATRSQSRVIPMPEGLRSALPVRALQEKSSTLIWGNDSAASTALWLHLLMEQSRRVPPDERSRLGDADHGADALDAWEKEAPAGFLLVSFRTSPPRLTESLGPHPALQTRWNERPGRNLRWYPPQLELSAAKVVRDVRRAIAQAKIAGAPIERVVFDEIDAIDVLLPNVARESAFWPTMFGLMASEPLTAIYVMASDSKREPAFSERFAAGIDYCFRLRRPPAARAIGEAEAFDATYLTMYKHPGLPNPRSNRKLPIRLAADGSVKVVESAAPAAKSRKRPRAR